MPRNNNQRIGCLILLFLLELLHHPSRANSSGQALELMIDARTTVCGPAVAWQGELAGFWNNPAGLYALSFPQIRTAFRQEFEDVSSGFFLYSLPLSPDSVLSLGLESLTAGSLVNASLGSQAPAELDFTLAAGYAANVARWFSLASPLALGIHAKYFRSTLAGESTGQALAADIGILVPLQLARVNLGLAIRNLGTPLRYETEFESLPTTGAVGLGWEHNLLPDFHFRLNLDSQVPLMYSKVYLNAGLELIYQKTFILRSGYRFFHDSDSFSAGLGLAFPPFGFDYGFLQNSLAPKHAVSIQYTFGPTLPTAAKPEAIPATPTPVPLDKTLFASLCAQGVAAYKLGKFEEAKEIWTQILIKYPNHPYASKYLQELKLSMRQAFAPKLKQAEVDFNQGRYQDAEETWRSVLAMDEENTVARAGLERLKQQAGTLVAKAQALADRREWSAALSTVREALSLAPHLPEALQLRSALEKRIQQSSAQNQLAASAVSRAQALAQKGDLTLAMNVIDDALAAAPGQSQLLQARESIPQTAHAQAQKLENQHQYRKALEAWKRIQEAAPEFAPAKSAYQLTSTYYQQKIQPLLESAAAAMARKNYPEAIDLGEKAYALAPESETGHFLALAHEALGIAHYRQDQTQDALRHWELALKLNPNRSILKKYIARATNKIQFLKNLGWEVQE